MSYISLILGAVLLFNAVWVSVASNIHAGVFALWFLALLFIFAGVFYHRIPMLVKCIFYIGAALAFAAVAFLLLWGKIDTADYDEDAVIVLGAGLRGDKPSMALAARLDTALEYYQKNPDAVIVVSGGQGDDELISEALAMERYLAERGVPLSSIIKEDRSTSTQENFSFSKALLDSYIGKDYTVVYVTNEYHIFRAGLIAKKVGIETASHISGTSPWYIVLPGTIRECMAIVRFYLP